MLYDVFLEAEATDIGNIGRDGSPEAIEGPFYIPGAPRLEPPYVLPQREDEVGDVLYFNGRVTDTSGRPLANAELDLWHADANGLYSNIHPGIPDWNLRGRFYTDSSGWYDLRTIVPPPYEIPKHGPTGRVLNAIGRHFFRPAHLHVKVRHSDHGEMTSQLYFKGGSYLENDVANAVRDGLVAEMVLHDSAEDLASRHLDKPYYELRYNFVLAPAETELDREAA
jgi:catechol 1,2-dioxygenase